MTSRRIPRWAAVPAALALLPWAVPAAAQAPDPAPTMLVLDSSGSMINNDAGGQTRIDAAKDAARTFIDSAGTTTPLGLVTYGGNTGETDADREAGCRDITMVTAPGTDTAGDMLDHIDALAPRGYTPIGDSLKAAAAELPTDGPGTIVLVSDGIDTCAPPPVCDVAAELKDNGVDLVINTVGFNVDAAARAELQCIADAAGGTYADASDADSLAAELKKATTRTYRAYDSDLDHIEGGTQAAPAGVDRDVETFSTTLSSLPEVANLSESSEAFYRLPVAPGERLIVTAHTTQLPSLNNWGQGGLILSASLDNAPSACRLDSSTGTSTSVDRYLTTSLHTQAAGEHGCDADEMVVKLERKGDWKAAEDLDVDVTVTRLGIPDMTGQPEPVAETSDPPQVPASGAAGDITPGTWFSDAAELSPGGAVRADIVPGETHFYKIPVEHGQRLVGKISLVEEAEDFENVDAGTMLHFQAYNPAGAEVRLDRVNVPLIQGREENFGYQAPILFGNRYGGSDGTGSPEAVVREVWQDGEQYLAVRYGKLFSQEEIDAGTQLAPLTYELVADAAGDPVPAPTFTPVSVETTATPSSETSTPDTDTTAADPAADSGETGGTHPLLWAGLAGIVVIGAAAAFAFTRTRRR